MMSEALANHCFAEAGTVPIADLDFTLVAPVYDVRPGEFLVVHVDQIDDYYSVKLNGVRIGGDRRPIPEGIVLNPILERAKINTLEIDGYNNPGPGWNFWSMTYRLAWYDANLKPVGRLPSIVRQTQGGPQDGGHFVSDVYGLRLI